MRHGVWAAPAMKKRQKQAVEKKTKTSVKRAPLMGNELVLEPLVERVQRIFGRRREQVETLLS